MKMRHALIGIWLVATSITAAPAQAMMIHDYVDYSVGFSFKDFPVFDVTAGESPEKKTTSEVKYLPGFDPSLGWLTDVTFGWTSHWDLLGESEAGNYLGPAAASGWSEIDMRVDLMDPDMSPVSETASVETSCDGEFACDYKDIKYGSFNQIFNPHLYDFTGTDPLEFMLTHTIEANLLRCYGEECVQEASPTWAGELFVKYEYEEHAVPEPSVLALLGIGLFGFRIAFAFKRRRHG